MAKSPIIWITSESKSSEKDITRFLPKGSSKPARISEKIFNELVNFYTSPENQISELDKKPFFYDSWFKSEQGTILYRNPERFESGIRILALYS